MASGTELPPLLLRADADFGGGTGRVLRCLALAQAWQARGGDVTFISRCENPALRARLEAAGVGLIPLRASDCGDGAIGLTRHHLTLSETALLVLDGEDFGYEVQQKLRMPAHLLIVIDTGDTAERYAADVVVSPRFGASASNDSHGAGTTLLTGPDYALLRPEFTVGRRRFRSIRTVARKILVTMGGTDADNVSLRVLEALGRLGAPGLEVRMIAGPANPHFQALKDATARSSLNVQLLSDVSDMTAVMAWADIAITDAGSTIFELACLGLPAIVLALDDKQIRFARELDTNGVAHNLGWHGAVSADRLATVIDVLVYSSFRRLRMSQQGRALVDGRGAERVVQALRQRSCMKAA